MNTKDAFPAVAAAPALLPLIAPLAAPILIGGAIAAGLVWLFSGDETPAAETAAKTGDAPPAPKRTGWTFFDSEGNEPAAVAKTALPDPARAAAAERIRQNDAEIAQTKRELARLNAPRTVSPPAVRTVTHQAAPAVAASPMRDVATAAAPRCVTPDVTYTYDRLGRQKTITHNSATTTFTYNDAGLVLTEGYSGGTLNGLSVTNGYDQYMRRTNLAALNGSTALARTAYGYDTASRLKTVADGVNTAAYGYLANSPLVGNVWFTNNTTLRMTTTKSYDYLNRLTAISSTAGGSNVAVFNYANNTANQRTSITNVDSSRWVYQYDALGQVISGKKYWSDGTPVAGQQFEYGFDDIGNRQSTAVGGDAVGANLRYASYSANNLNQYTSRDVPGFVNVLGSATNNATVTIWGDNGAFSATSRKGDYYRGELGMTNTANPVWLTVTNLAVLNNGSNPDIVTNTIGKTYVPKTSEAFYYDLDGNLTNDGRWVYTWDAENRLVQQESLSSAPTGSKFKLEFAYDSKGRRIQKLVSTNNGSAYVAQYTNRFVYDGWNLIAILNPQSAILQAFTWGMDLSGSLQGAGGVGGLLIFRDQSTLSSQQSTNFLAYDGNGNAAALVNATNGAVTAQYEYGPFGEVLRTTGPIAKANAFRFSTKFQDDESDQLYYGYRSYNPSTGRWLSRDPIGEAGGMNCYVNCFNDVIKNVDWLGLWKVERRGQPRAMAYPENNDTIRRLAGNISLNASEWKKWLKPVDVYTRPYDLDTPLTECDSFSVPNTAYVNYNVGFVDFRLAHYMLLYTSYIRERWSQAGYQVRYFRLILGADIVKSQLNDPNIYTFAHIGHGASGNLILGDDESEWIKPGRYTPFGIDEMFLIACDTDYGSDKWKSNVSKHGILMTVEGDLSISRMRFKVYRGEGD